MQTPEFLIWALQFACPARGSLDGSDPERVERQLRAARAVSDAQRDGRVFEGLCLDPPDGFRIDEALAIFGGEAAVRQACGDCPANALAEAQPSTLAGCYGILALPDEPSPFHAAIDRGIAEVYGHLDWSRFFPETRPGWYGLWQCPFAEAETLLDLFLVLSAAQIQQQPMRDFLLALNAAYNIGCRVYVQLVPPGRVDGPWWRLSPHCPRCKAVWTGAGRPACRVCGYIGHPAPDKKRHARGRRPYFPLDRLLGAQQAAETLLRYEAQRKRPESPDWA